MIFADWDARGIVLWHDSGARAGMYGYLSAALPGTLMWGLFEPGTMP